MITKINDYIPKLLELYPDISEADIKKCINYGWRMFYYFNLCGCDVLVTDPKTKMWLYCGNLLYDPIKHFMYYKKKLAYKIRLMFRRSKQEWDGYYYTVIDKPKRNKQSTYKIENKFIFKLLDEAKIYYNSSKYFIRFRHPTNLGYKRYKLNFTAKKAEIVYIRENPMTFLDLMVSKNKYEFL